MTAGDNENARSSRDPNLDKPSAVDDRLARREQRFQRLLERNQFRQAEQDARDLAARFPKSELGHLRIAQAVKAQGRLREAATYYERSINECPAVIGAFSEYAELIRHLQADRPEVIVDFMERFLDEHRTSAAPYAAYGSYLRDAVNEPERALAILQAGLVHEPESDLLNLELLKLGLSAKDPKRVEETTRRLLELGVDPTTDIVRFVRSDTEPEPELLASCRTLDDLIGPMPADRPTIVEAEGHDFGFVRQDRPCLALYAYAFPRPNLDVIYELYKMLEERGHQVVLFLRAEELALFDFADVVISPDDVVYSAWSGFFSTADFADCVITNDLCGIDARSLPTGCKLVFHAPHNTNVGPLHKSNFKAHYSTYLAHHDAPKATSSQANRNTPDRICLIPNTYTKDEYLARFVAGFTSRPRVIGYCPTSLMHRFDAPRGSQEFQRQVDNYLGDLMPMIDAILGTFATHPLVYRPFWNHAEHWVVTKPLLERFGGHERFVVDTRSNSKYTLAVSDVFLTDVSGLANTYTNVTGRPGVSFLPGADAGARTPLTDVIGCATVDDVIEAIRTVLADRQAQNVTAANDRLGGLTYLADNVDAILEDRQHPDWHYFDLA